MRKIYLFMGMWVALLSAKAQKTATFEDIVLPDSSYYNGSDGAGGFMSGEIWFPNNYNAAWGNWNGFSVSNMQDTLTAGYANQYSAITAGGADSSENYAVVYFQEGLKLNFDEPVKVEGFYVTNSVYAFLSMRNGDDWTKKFGGADGSDPDYFLLKVWGIGAGGNNTDTVDFYLADFRSENPEDDYIVNQWQWVDLKSLGTVDTVKFHLVSTDMGEWGMNTPAYFCIDNFTTAATSTFSGKSPFVKPALAVYPNPVSDAFRMEVPERAESMIITDSTGRIVHSEKIKGSQVVQITALSGMPSGAYFLKVKTQNGVVSEIIMKY